MEKIAELCVAYPNARLCQEIGAEMEKRKSAYMRFGRSSPDTDETTSENEDTHEEKRKSAYMRFGKRSGDSSGDSPISSASSSGTGQLAVNGGEMEKRKSAYMRFGKRKSAYMRFGKRSSATVDDDEIVDAGVEKRKSAYMRFGKRSESASPAIDHQMLADDDQQVEGVNKRKSAYMRFGRR